MTNQGIYIALEGLDGSGKSTLFKNLIEIFKANNISFDTLCPTQISTPHSIIERIYHSNKKFKRVNFFRTIIFAYRSFKATKKVKWQSSLILGDRSIVVTYVKHWRKIFNSRFMSVMFVNVIEPFIKSPDYVLLLDAPESILLYRISQKSVIEIDETPENLRLMKKAYQELRNSKGITRLSKTIWIDIDSNKQPYELAQEVYGVIKNLVAK